MILAPGGKAKLRLVYEALFHPTHCDPSPTTKKSLPPGKYDLPITLPIELEGGGMLTGSAPLSVTK